MQNTHGLFERAMKDSGNNLHSDRSNLRRDEASTSSSIGTGSSSSVVPSQHQLAETVEDSSSRQGIPLLRMRRQLQLTTSQQQSLPTEGLITTEREHGGYTTMYSCSSNATANQISETTLLFDFEFVLPHPEEPLIEVVKQDFPKVELGILFRMAMITGIFPDCDLSKQLSDRWEKLTDTLQAGKETTRLDQPQFLSEDNLIMGLSSWSPDNVDEIGTCTFIKEVSDGMICVPVVGNMTVYYIGDDKQAIIDYLNHHLQKEMNDQRVSLGGPGGVKETYFIGTRERGGKASDAPPSLTTDTPTTLRSSSEDKLKLLPILIAAGVGALFVLFFVLFVVRKRSNRDQEEEGDFASAVQDISAATTDKQDDQGDAAADDQVESPGNDQAAAPGDDHAVTTAENVENSGNRLILPPPIMRTSGSSSSSTSGSSSGGAPVPEEVRATPATQAMTEPDKSEDLPSYLPTTIDTSKTVVVPSLASPPATPESKPPSNNRSSGPVSVDILPPLPPGAPSAKVAAAVIPPAAAARKRRKKKKKKKTVALERTNSRDSINEMETIQEGQESGDDASDGESSYGSGSEYSWSTDETDSRPSSRDPSPTRLTTTNSAVTELASNTTSAPTKPPKWV